MRAVTQKDLMPVDHAFRMPPWIQDSLEKIANIKGISFDEALNLLIYNALDYRDLLSYQLNYQPRKPSKPEPVIIEFPKHRSQACKTSPELYYVESLSDAVQLFEVNAIDIPGKILCCLELEFTHSIIVKLPWNNSVGNRLYDRFDFRKVGGIYEGDGIPPFRVGQARRIYDDPQSIRLAFFE